MDLANLQHLDESNAEVEVRHVAADQRQAKEGADGYNDS